MKKPTPEEIAAEVAALKTLVPVGPHARSTGEIIKAMIDELTEGVDTTAEEFNEMSQAEQDGVFDAANWRDGDTARKPSNTFEGLAEKP